MHLNRERQILTIRNRILVIGSNCVNKHRYDFKFQEGTNFPNHFISEWWKDLTRYRIFHKCLGHFNMLTVDGSSETWLFREWSNEIFHNVSYRKKIGYDDLLFFRKCLKFNVDKINGTKKLTKNFSFSR